MEHGPSIPKNREDMKLRTNNRLPDSRNDKVCRISVLICRTSLPFLAVQIVDIQIYGCLVFLKTRNIPYL